MAKKNYINQAGLARLVHNIKNLINNKLEGPIVVVHSGTDPTIYSKRVRNIVMHTDTDISTDPGDILHVYE